MLFLNRLYKYIFLNLTYPLECLQVPPGVHVPPFENHCPMSSTRLFSFTLISRLGFIKHIVSYLIT